ncbi:MAG: hypothetical protein IT257_09495 [Chitinophagaceae bacterium]|nr:hypothetical protein [Chitinophagaceae bacterium]
MIRFADMNKIVIILGAVALFFTSCNKNFKVGAEYKDVTAVFALLSKADTFNYVKITKGYYDELQDNLLLAQNSDSIYYNNLEVKMMEISNGAVVDSFTLPRVDLNNEGFVKDSGIFAQTPNYGYKFHKALNSDRRYRLKIKNLSNGKVIEGETEVINHNQIIFQKPYINTQPLDFAVPTQTFDFAWSAPATAVFFDVVLRFWYQEFNINTMITTRTYRDLTLIKNVLNNGAGGNATMSNSDFYRMLNSEVGVAPSFITRRVDTADLMLITGGQVLKTYIDATTAQGGITYDQIKPNYTNLKGEDVLGIMSTRGIKTLKDIPLTKPTIDSIVLGSLTKNLSFVGISSE